VKCSVHGALGGGGHDATGPHHEHSGDHAGDGEYRHDCDQNRAGHLTSLRDHWADRTDRSALKMGRSQTSVTHGR
jgi:hypothetical protein